jgi:hypothetical protein
MFYYCDTFNCYKPVNENHRFMKKSDSVLLGALFIMAAASCGQDKKEPGWTSGNDADGKVHDTTFNGSTYRHYNRGWYPVYHGMICPGYYSRPYSYGEIAQPGFRAAMPSSASVNSHGVSTGGFGSTAHGGAGE